jgi:hypothetical protein
MIRRNIGRTALLATALLVALPSPVAAGQWSDRTILTFSDPVKVPGTTLPAGTYVFELVNPASSIDVVKITDHPGSKLYALASVVPTIRPEPTEDVILLFTPMDKSTMPALRGWYPPGGRHGHLFLYSKEEARSLADRTKSVVLSRDVDNSSQDAGTIVVLRPGGESSPWTQDTTTQREWDQWVQAGADRRQPASQDQDEPREAMTPMVVDAPQGEQAQIADVEDHPEKYYARTLSIDGTVDEIYGPHLFELDEPDWGQPEGDVLVFLPHGTLAAVRENDRVTVTGTLRHFARSSALAEARWLDVDRIMTRPLDEVPVLEATRIIGGNNNRALVIAANTGPTMMTPAGTPAPITDLAAVREGDLDLVGQRVALTDVTIQSVDRDGFFLTSANRSLFVLLNDPDKMTLRTGDSVSVQGVVLALPPKVAAGLKMPADTNSAIYVYAESVRPTRAPN